MDSDIVPRMSQHPATTPQGPEDEGENVGQEFVSGIVGNAVSLSDEDTCDGGDSDCDEIDSVSDASELENDGPLNGSLNGATTDCKDDEIDFTNFDGISDLDDEEVFRLTVSDCEDADEASLEDDAAHDFTQTIMSAGVDAYQDQLQDCPSKTNEHMQWYVCDLLNGALSGAARVFDVEHILEGVKSSPITVGCFMRMRCPQQGPASSQQQMQAKATACWDLAQSAEKVQVPVNWKLLQEACLPAEKRTDPSVEVDADSMKSVAETQEHDDPRFLVPAPPSSAPKSGFRRHANKDRGLAQDKPITRGQDFEQVPKAPAPPSYAFPSARRQHRPVPPGRDHNANFNPVVPPNPQLRAGHPGSFSIPSEDTNFQFPGGSQDKPSALMLDLGIGPSGASPKPPRCISARPRPIYFNNGGSEFSELLVVKSKRAKSLLPAIGKPHGRANTDWNDAAANTAVGRNGVPFVS